MAPEYFTGIPLLLGIVDIVIKSEQNYRTICNIGIKHDFLCINICWAPREMLKPETETIIRSLLLHKTSFHSKTLEKLLRKVIFSRTYNSAECERFENAASRENDDFILTS